MGDKAEIFLQLKSLLAKYESPLVARSNGKSRYELWTTKEVEIAGRKRKELYFAGLVVQSTYVGYYYMPIYGNPKLQSLLGKELLSMLKGKACFHIKKLDKELLMQIRKSLDEGFKCYKRLGWV